MNKNHPFQTIAIFGVGLIGGSLAMAMKRKMPDLKIIGISSQNTLDEALAQKTIDFGYTREQYIEGIAEADLIFLCTPISHINEILSKIIQHAKSGACISDAGSTKKEICNNAAKYIREDIHFIGGHPMAGNEGRGIHWADPLLYENVVYVLTPLPNTPQSVIDHLVNLIECIGAKTLLLNPGDHDRIAAAISHVPQLMAITLMNLIANKSDSREVYLKLAAGGFRDMTRIASSPYEMWKDIFQTNKEVISQTVDEYSELLNKLRDFLKDGNLKQAFDIANKYRLSIPRDTKGFLRPNYDLLVDIEDKPGVIAFIANILANQNINIKDIEVLKVREGESGTLRLSLESEEARKTAQELFKIENISSRYRK